MIDILKSNFIKFKDLSLKNKLMILIPFFAILIISIIRALKVNQISDFYVFYFAGKNARMLRFWFDNANSCGLSNPVVIVKELVKEN